MSHGCIHDSSKQEDTRFFGSILSSTLLEYHNLLLFEGHLNFDELINSDYCIGGSQFLNI